MGAAAYGAFVIHPPMIVGPALALHHVAIPAELKFVLVLAGGVAGSFGITALVMRSPAVARVVGSGSDRPPAVARGHRLPRGRSSAEGGSILPDRLPKRSRTSCDEVRGRRASDPRALDQVEPEQDEQPGAGVDGQDRDRLDGRRLGEEKTSRSRDVPAPTREIVTEVTPEPGEELACRPRPGDLRAQDEVQQPRHGGTGETDECNERGGRRGPHRR